MSLQKWLRFGQCLDNIDVMGSLESYFLANFNLDDDSTENNRDKKRGREKRLVNASKQIVGRLYAMSVQPVMPLFGSFYTFRQVEEPLTHILYHSTLRLYRSLLSRFILPCYLRIR